MKQIMTDLHLHSKYAQAVSKYMSLELLYDTALTKGIDVLSVGDFTHPKWYAQISEKLESCGSGIYSLKDRDDRVRFLMGTELSCIFRQDGVARRVHVLVYAPSLEVVAEINSALNDRGVNLVSDGRPILPFSVVELCGMLFEIDERIAVIPAHIWTPWFGALGSKTGFRSLRECFGEYAEKIYAIETGLSSDPWMNWQISEFKSRAIVLFSDAHSAIKLGRVLTVFERDGVFDLGR